MLRITKLADYAIVLLTHMAGAGRRESHNSKDLASATRLPLPMVSKILKALAREGVLESQRGAKGGYRLARAPEAITAASIIAALEGPIALTSCTDASASQCDIEMFCGVRRRWDLINSAVRDALEDVKLTDLASGPVFPRSPARVGGHAASETEWRDGVQAAPLTSGRKG